MGFDYESFNADEVEVQDFELIPAGIYNATIISSAEMKAKSSDSEYFALQLEIVDGEHKGRRLFTNIVFKKKNGEPFDAFVAKVCKAIGCKSPGPDQSSWLNKPVQVKVGLRKREDNGEVSNEIKDWIIPDKKKVAAAKPEAVKTNRQAVAANSEGDDIPF